ncbi:50S ribosomal protein L11 methyltransferase [Pedobacter sp. MR2016-24]|uniref:50S ribosomal protein L11 methyltransferase n=1 Tax=Pedobacter sp. MR2016-24 TaxID=2994466 RepID=UPI0022460D16|nr:50S ribosomal protein L11 methyltransferase [Pedobacter sp. MR2016-24]MCX2486499.1 50S ribosomal protein L11 methyltransferase [Pedobacter sp. MR2016-24]
MQYIKVIFSFINIKEYQQDLFINELADIGFNTFEDTHKGFAAFIDEDSYSHMHLNDVLVQFEDEFEYSYTVTEIEAENWNEEWEKNFEPLIVDDSCYVRATFHEPQPQYQYEIVIDPKMAFGTGHHQTTTMMMQYILDTDVKGQSILDMGCGTGILAILASKKGARELTAIDNDEVCYLSAIENTELNNIDNIIAICGGKEVIPAHNYDIILANINRNILLDQIPVYAEVLKTGGLIFFSGFYEAPDLQMIKDACEAFQINYCDHKKIGDWVAAQFKKA